MNSIRALAGSSVSTSSPQDQSAVVVLPPDDDDAGHGLVGINLAEVNHPLMPDELVAGGGRSVEMKVNNCSS